MGVNGDITFRNISITGNRMPEFSFSGAGADFVSGPIRIENPTFNGKKLGSLEDAHVTVGKFVTGVTIG